MRGQSLQVNKSGIVTKAQKIKSQKANIQNYQRKYQVKQKVTNLKNKLTKHNQVKHKADLRNKLSKHKQVKHKASLHNRNSCVEVEKGGSIMVNFRYIRLNTRNQVKSICQDIYIYIYIYIG